LIKELDRQKQKSTNTLACMAYMDLPGHPQPAPPSPAAAAASPLAEKASPPPAPEAASPLAEEASPPTEAAPTPAAEAAPPQAVLGIAEPVYPSEDKVHVVIHSPWPTLMFSPNRILRVHRGGGSGPNARPSSTYQAVSPISRAGSLNWRNVLRVNRVAWNVPPEQRGAQATPAQRYAPYLRIFSPYKRPSEAEGWRRTQ
jgi:hypothetical protein